jgi:hypothetical protein
VRDAVDFWGAPEPTVLKLHDLDPLPYDGRAKPPQSWFEWARALGVGPKCMIIEQDPNWSQGGYSAGHYGCLDHEGRCKATGHTGSLMVAVSDGSKWDPNYGADNIYAFGRAWSDAATMPFFPYGNEFACYWFIQGALAGINAHLLVLGYDGHPGGMIPETWGNGTVATQLVSPSPIPDTDYDVMHVPYETVGPVKPTAPNFDSEADNMAGEIQSIFINNTQDIFFVDNDILWWKHVDGLGASHPPVQLSVNADSAHPDINIMPTGYGPIINLRRKTIPTDPPGLMRVKLVPFGGGAVYQAEAI